MEESTYRSILKRVGTALVLAGLADVGWMVYCIIHKISYSSSFSRPMENMPASAQAVFLPVTIAEH